MIGEHKQNLYGKVGERLTQTILGGKIGAFQAPMAHIFHDMVDDFKLVGTLPNPGNPQKCKTLDNLIKMIEIRDDHSVP